MIEDGRAGGLVPSMPQAAGEGTLVPMERPSGWEGLRGAARPGSSSEPWPCLLCDPWQFAPISGPQVLSDSGCDGTSRIWRPTQPPPTAPVLASRLAVLRAVKSSGHGVHSPPSAGGHGSTALGAECATASRQRSQHARETDDEEICNPEPPPLSERIINAGENSRRGGPGARVRGEGRVTRAKT